MFVGITNTPRDYSWGSATAIAELLGTPASGAPQAELWLGAHPSAAATLDGRPIDAYIQADPKGFLGAASEIGRAHV